MRNAASLLGLVVLTFAMAEDSPASLKHAEGLWKTHVRKPCAKLQYSETENVLAYGSVDKKMLETISKAAERSVVFARKSVGYDKEPVKRENVQMSDRPYHWDGKLIIIVCKERQEFVDLFNKLKNAKPDPSESFLVHHEKADSYLLMGPTGTGVKNNPEIVAVEQAGIATLTRRHDPLPRWLIAGFGHMLAHKFDPKQFASERSRVPALASKCLLKDVMVDENSELPPGGLVALQASLVECLSQSSTFADQWFTLLDETAYRGGNMQAALTELKLKEESIHIEWKNGLWKK
jgi:hypothetical protein